MNKARLNIATSKLVGNSGQLDWLPRNPRQWTQGDIDRTIKSIGRDADFLEDRPLLAVPAESGKGERYIVFAGNLRLKACKESNVKTAPVVVYFPESDEDRETVKRRAMLDNGSFGSWDYDALANEWDDLPLVDLGIPAWEPEQDADTFGAGEEGPAATEDDFDETQDEIHVLCAKGDIWQLGDHRLMCGDSTDEEMVKKLMGGDVVDMVFQSPPYNAGDSEKLSGNTHFEESKYKNYDDNNADYLGLLTKSTKNAIDNSKYTFVNLQPLAGNKVAMVDFLASTKNLLCDILIWRKTTVAPLLARRVCNSSFEFVFVFCKDNNSRAIGTRDFRGTVSNVYDCPPQRNNEYAAEHAATFSVEFVGHYIETFTNKGESVADLFGGTGTTMIAAEQLGRKCYMMELDPHYCDVIIARWEKLTGKQAIKLN